MPEVLADGGLEVAEEGHGLAGHLEREAVLVSGGVARVAGPLAVLAAGDGPLDLADAPAFPVFALIGSIALAAQGPVEPRLLGLAGGDPAELAHVTEGQRALLESLVEAGQLTERLADPEPLFGLAVAEPEVTVGVLEQARHAASRRHA